LSAQSLERERESRNGRPPRGDPYIRPPRLVALEPVRVVVELRQDEYAALVKACGAFASVPQLVRLVALRLAREALGR
jgi:hypothetical protein